MLRYIVLLLCFTTCFSLTAQNSYSSQRFYKLGWEEDGLAIMGGVLGVLGSRALINGSPNVDAESIVQLDPSRLNALDRGVIFNYSLNADNLSDKFLYGSLALPLTLTFSKKARREGLAISSMYLETLLINYSLTNVIKAATGRYRPYVYNSNLDIDIRINDGSNVSFCSGHTSTVASMSFMTAKIFTDLHPDSSARPWVWGAAITLPAVTGYLRVKAGKHFPTDVIAGYALGAGIGYLIPALHKKKHISVYPAGAGLGLTWTF